MVMWVSVERVRRARSKESARSSERRTAMTVPGWRGTVESRSWWGRWRGAGSAKGANVDEGALEKAA